MRGSLAVVVLVIAACAPAIDGPIERQRAIDRDDGERLAAQLRQLPGAVSAAVVLHRAARDPLAVAPPAIASLSAVIAVDDGAAPDDVRAAAGRLARAAMPELEHPPVIEVHVAAHRPALAKVGPFWVEDSSSGALKVALALGCLVIAGLAGALATTIRRHRLGSSAQ